MNAQGRTGKNRFAQWFPELLSSSEGNGSQVSSSWNKEVRADSSLYGVREAAVAVVYNCIARACSTLALSVYSWVCTLGTQVHLGACVYTGHEISPRVKWQVEHQDRRPCKVMQ